MEGVKWVAIASGSAGQPAMSATMLLSDHESGAIIGAMNAAWSTRATGAQARSHLLALREIFPDLREVTVCDRCLQSARDFVRFAAGQGCEGRLVVTPEAAVRDQDIVVSTVPCAGEPFLDASSLLPDSFASMVDPGRCWRTHSLERLDLVATDDIGQFEPLAAQGQLAFGGTYDFTLEDFALGRGPAERPGRNALIFGGIGLADLAAAALVWRTLHPEWSRGQKRGQTP